MNVLECNSTVVNHVGIIDAVTLVAQLPLPTHETATRVLALKEGYECGSSAFQVASSS